MTIAQFDKSPAVNFQEEDRSDFVSGVSVVSAAVVGPFRRGPEKAVVTTPDEFLELFEVSTDWGFAAHTALDFLEEGNQLTVLRVQKNARRAGLVVYNDVFSSFDNTANSNAMPFPFGTFDDYLSGVRQFINAIITGNFVTGNVTAVGLNDGVTNYTQNVAFITDHNTTARAVTDAINALINTGIAVDVSPGGASAIAMSGNALNNIRVVSPEGKTFTLSLSTTGGASQPTFAVATSNAAQHKLFEIFAENPGKHGNNLGVRFSDIKNSTYKQLTLTFSADFVALNNIAFNFTYKGQTDIVNVVYASSHANTITAIGTAIQNLIGVAGTVLVDAVARTIKIISPEAGEDNISVTTPLVTLGASQATCAVTTVAPTANDDTFKLELFNRSNQIVPIKTYVVSLRKINDGFNSSLYIEDVVNTGADKSIDIRINHYETNLLGQLKGISTSTIYWLNGGTDGTQPVSADLATAWDTLKDRILFPNARLLLNAGFADSTVQTKMIDVAESRGVSVAILDVPSASQEATAAATYRNATLNANSSFAMIATNDPEIVDSFSQRRFYVPPSARLGAVIARSLNIAPYLSPAGLNRGYIRNIVGLRYNYSQGQRDTLATAQINPIINLQGGFGYVLWDAITLLKKKTVMSYASSRFNMCYIREECERFFPTLLHEPIDDNLFFKVEQFGEQLLQPMIERGALRNGKLVANKTNNKPTDEDAGRFNVSLFLDFPRPAREINIKLIPTRAGGIQFIEQL